MIRQMWLSGWIWKPNRNHYPTNFSYKHNRESSAPGILGAVLMALVEERCHDLEKVQGKAAKKIQRTGSPSCEEKLEGLGPCGGDN